MCFATDFLKIPAQYIDEGLLVLELDRKWSFFMVSFISSENVTDVAVLPPVRLWCVISFVELCF